MKKIFSIVAILFIAFTSKNSKAQLNCATTEMNNELLKNNPELVAQQIENNNALIAYLQANPTGEKNRAGQYIIPIVFHIIHNYGNEDISDAQIYDALKILNNDYNKLNADTSAVVPTFQSIIAKVGFEFRLARIDPNGNCTNGIDRIYSYKTTVGEDKAKLNTWDKTKYFNIWVVSKFLQTGVAGYAYYPGSGIYSGYDGVIILSNYIGAIGTGNANQSRALTHEIGHSFNLPHTWGSTNNPGVSCGDDGVSDTPVTIGHTSCTTADLADNGCTGAIENTQNYMEYSYCSNMFTNGQKARMIATITTNSGSRGNLVSTSNLTATGVATLGLPLCTLKPDFKTNRYFSCIGNYVTLSNKSSGDTAIMSYLWNVTNSNVTNVTTNSTTATFNSAGWQSVTLAASSANAPSGSLTKTNYIYVSDPNAAKGEGYSQNFENATNNAEWPLFNIYENYFKYSIAANGRNGGNCIKYNSFDDRSTNLKRTGTPYGDLDEIISPAFNIANSTNCKLSFYTSASYISNSQDTIADIFDVLYSPNCGANWYTLYTATKTSNNLFNVGGNSTAFTPTNASQWMYREITLPAAALSSSTYFKFRYRPSDAANNLYIDDILVSPYPLAVNNINNTNNSFEIYPNPSNNGKTIIYIQNTEKVNVQITDITGKIIKEISTQEIETQHGQLEVSTNWTTGLYMVNIFAGNKKLESKKLIVNN